MNEVRALVEAFDAARARGERCALATVVSVEGSSYRRPGARMLVTESEATTGTISAGCLEGDVVEHARHVMATGEAKLVAYDTTATTDEVAWGLGLGCNGVVRVLVEPLAPGSLYVEALRRSCETRPDDAGITVATVYECAAAGGDTDLPIGARVVVDERGAARYENVGDRAAATLEREVRAWTRDGAATSAARVWHVEGAAAGVFVETLPPPVPLVIFGAGPDVVPVVELARGLGWRTEVVDPRARPASRSRFAVADRVTLLRADDVAAQVEIGPRTMALLMTHDYAQDLALLGVLLASPARYVGAMGPRARTERMLAQLSASRHSARVDAASLARLHAPAGLDIGASGPAEIALSIVAEMRAVLEGRSGGPLRERRGSIHAGDAAVRRA